MQIILSQHKMEHIYVSMHGRFGNQLFRYATARCIQLRYGGELILNFGRVYREGSHKPKENGFEDSLNFFRVAEYKKASISVLNKGGVKQRIMYALSMIIINLFGAHTRLFKYINCINSANGLYLAYKGPEYCPIRKPKFKDCFVKGRFEDVRYFDEIRNQLIAEIKPVHDRRLENKALYDVIEKQNSICVSVRRGDYVSNENNAKRLNVCNKNYWNDAIKYMDEHVENPVYVVFSDDIGWCKAHMECLRGRNSYYETGNDPIWEKLRLMYSCKHFIISNSTFSWWAQYLSRNEEKIVVSPDRWFLNRTRDYPLILDTFVRIKPD